MVKHIIEVGAFQVNCTIFQPVDGEAWVCDPGGDPGEIERYLDQHDLSVAGYVLTHGHIDHLAALPALLRNRPAPSHMHPADAGWAFTDVNGIPPFYPPLSSAPPSLLPDLTGDFTDAGDRTGFSVLETPGHTPGCVCLLFPEERLILSGDTLFAGSAGRTDLPGGDAEKLMHSLTLLGRLPGDWQIVPGHGPQTTLARERQSNPFMRGIQENKP